MEPVNLILLGPPGVGKSTQAALLARRYPLAILSTGNMLRAEVEAETELGLAAKAAMDSGQLVGDDVIVAMVRKCLEELAPSQGFLLDGFPRTTAQAAALDAMLHDLGQPLSVVVQPLLEREEVVRRMASRRLCRRCSTPTSVSPEAPVETCRSCGGELIQRPDDRPEVIRKRMEIYEQQTSPLAAYYQEAELLAPVNAQGDQTEVFERIVTAIEMYRLPHRLPAARSIAVNRINRYNR